MHRLRIVIVSPALADANNGNWQTARRWKSLLAPHTVRIVREWPDALAAQDDVMLALHARRSASAVQAWFAQRGPRGLGLVLTGTDLYRDIQHDHDARHALQCAHSLVVLQGLGAQSLPEAHRHKSRVILASGRARQTLAKTARHLRVVMVGHLREEKDPQTLMATARLLQGQEDILIDHIGAALDPAWAQAARETQAQCPQYRWLGPLPHRETLQRIQRAHLLVHTSRMEGGAHVLMEALRSGTPVLASRIDGNLGMLGDNYPGTFAVGDAPALAHLLQQCRSGQTQAGGMLSHLTACCVERATLFEPQTERAALHRWVQDLWTP
jgi:putative glycosyltransferase (TIGR04348 family)